MAIFKNSAVERSREEKIYNSWVSKSWNAFIWYSQSRYAPFKFFEQSTLLCSLRAVYTRMHNCEKMFLALRSSNFNSHRLHIPKRRSERTKNATRSKRWTRPRDTFCLPSMEISFVTSSSLPFPLIFHFHVMQRSERAWKAISRFKRIEDAPLSSTPCDRSRVVAILESSVVASPSEALQRKDATQQSEIRDN